MNPEVRKIFYELKPYLVFDKTKNEYNVKEDVSKEIKDKFEHWKKMEDDEEELTEEEAKKFKEALNNK